jgi:riboflavin kinase / FMN adenylyltransferase
MRRWFDLGEVDSALTPSVVAIGVFDGVHRGHQDLISRAKDVATSKGISLIAVTFDPHPRSVVGSNPPLALASLDFRLTLLERCGVDATLVLPFTKELASLSPDEFLKKVLVDHLKAQHVVVGDNFKFGFKAAGDTDYLAKFGNENGFTTAVFERFSDGKEPWSSTRARNYIESGEVDKAALVLGRFPRLEGIVVHGDHRGRELGYPTANLETPHQMSVPEDGIYAGYLVRTKTKEVLPAAISIGTNPTFDGKEKRVEAYALDRTDLDLYGEQVSFDFVKQLRKTVKYDSVDELVSQMARDVEETRRLTSHTYNG